MSNVALAESPILFFLNNANRLNAGGSLLTQVGGVNYPTFQDQAGTIPLPNPIPLNSRGEISNSSGVSCQLFLTAGIAYTFTLFDADGNQLWTAGNVQAIAPVAVGNMTDEKGSGGVPGFVANVDFIPGVTTTLTLSTNYGSTANLWVAFDGAEQGPDSYSLSGTVLMFAAPIPVGTNKVYVKGGTTLSVGTPGVGSITDASVAANAAINSSKISYNQGGSGAVARSQQSKNQDVVSVKDFGAKGDGVTDDTAAILAADLWCRNQTPPRELYFPGGTYMASQITFYPYSNWYGEGRDSTLLQQISGANKDFVYGVNSSSNWSTGLPPNSPTTPYPYCFKFRDLGIDGGYVKTGGGNTIGSGLVFWGDRFIIQNVGIRNCAEYGLRTGYTDSGTDYGVPWFTSTINGLCVDTSGKHGIWDNGPHDMQRFDVVVLDASQSAANTYDGIYVDQYSSGIWVGAHPSTRSGSTNMRYALNCLPGSSGQVSGGSQIEGGYTANMNLTSSGWVFDPSTKWYANHTDRSIFMGGTNCSLNKIMGTIGAPLAGGPASIGIVFSSASGDSVNNNYIDVDMQGQSGAPIAFGTQDNGENVIKIRSYVSGGGGGLYQTPNPTDQIEYYGFGGTLLYANTWDQSETMSVPPNGSATWTFPYLFPVVPIVSLSLMEPGGVPSSMPWTSARSASSVTIYNANSFGVTVSIRAAMPSY